MQPSAALTRDDAILAHVGLVRRIARDYWGQGLSHGDLIQEGLAGLIRAHDEYNHSFGVPFNRWIRIGIRSSISHAVRAEQNARRAYHVDLDSLPFKTDDSDKVSDQVWDAIESLPEPDQPVIISLFGLAGQPKEGREPTAARLGTSEKLVRKAKTRAMKAMRAHLTA